jgi:N-acetylneuraminate synthase
MSQEVEVVQKPWGRYEVLHRESGRAVKILVVEPGQSLSLQSHDHRAEHWFVLRGEPLIILGTERKRLKVNDAVDIPAGTQHRLSNDSSEPVAVLEVQHGERIEEGDITRYRDRYGRPSGGVRNRVARTLEGPLSIAEIGCNHKGEIPIAVEMIRVAATFCKVDVVKFQKRCVRELLSPAEYDAPHPNPQNSFGATYGAHREFLEFTADQHRYLRDVCEEWGVVYGTSVWDVTSAKEIAALEPLLMKVPSACNTNFRLLDVLFNDFGGEIHISLGMTTRAEETEILELAERRGRLHDVVLYHCISGYPVDDEDLSLLEIPRLKRDYDGRVKGIGFSGHHRGIAPDMAALTLGAQYFERHFTLDRSWKGTDHAASLEPNGFRRLARDLRNVTAALRPQPKEILDIEVEQRRKLKKFVALDEGASRSGKPGARIGATTGAK